MAALMFWHMKVLLYTVFKDLTIRRVVTRTLTIERIASGVRSYADE